MALFGWLDTSVIENNIKVAGNQVNSGFQNLVTLLRGINVNQVNALNRNTDQLKRIADLLQRAIGPPVPRFVRYKYIGETTVGQKHFMQIEFDWELIPNLDTADIDHIEVAVVRDGAAPEIVSVAKDQTSTVVEGEVGSVLGVSIYGKDAAGNPSAVPAVIPDFTVTDTLPPPNITGLNMKVVGERVVTTPDA